MLGSGWNKRCWGEYSETLDGVKGKKITKKERKKKERKKERERERERERIMCECDVEEIVPEMASRLIHAKKFGVRNTFTETWDFAAQIYDVESGDVRLRQINRLASLILSAISAPFVRETKHWRLTLWSSEE